MQRKCSNLALFPFSQLQDSEAAPKSRLPLNFLRPLSQVLNILRWDDIVQIYRVYLYNVILQIVTVLCNSIHPACPLFASCPNYSGMSCKMKSLFYILIIIIFRPIKNKSWKGLIWFLFSGSELGGSVWDTFFTRHSFMLKSCCGVVGWVAHNILESALGPNPSFFLFWGFVGTGAWTRTRTWQKYAGCPSHSGLRKSAVVSLFWDF